MSKGHVLITGGAGFIGSHLVDRLLARGFDVTILDCLLPQVHGDAEMDREGWPVYLNRRARRIRGNILEDGVVEASLSGITHVAHLAASVGVSQSMTNIVDYTRNNTLAAAIILEVLSRRNHSVRRIAVASSMSIYGEGEYVLEGDRGTLSPEMRPRAQLEARDWDPKFEGRTLQPVATTEKKSLSPASIYAVNKRDHEEMFLAVGAALDIPTVALRLFNAYGSRQALSNPYTGVAAIFISRLLNDQPPLVFEDGRQRRDFVHVLDVADAFATVLGSERHCFDAYNVGSGQSITINEVALLLARLLKKNISPVILNRYRIGDIRHCFADTSKLTRDFGFQPTRGLEAGMAELIGWVKKTSKPIDRGAEVLAELTTSRLVV